MTVKQLSAKLNRPALILITDRARAGDPLPAVRRLPRGACVLLRDYDHPDRAALARRLAAACRRRGLALLVAGDGELAARVGAAGLHLPEHDAGAARCWRRRFPGWWITAAAHSGPAVRRAAALGADAVLLAPAFATRSHPDARPLGPLRFAAITRDATVPIYALGGVGAQSARRLVGIGAAGLAAIGGLAAQGRAGRRAASTLAHAAAILRPQADPAHAAGRRPFHGQD